MNNALAMAVTMAALAAGAALLWLRSRNRPPQAGSSYRLRRTDSLALTAQHTVHVVEWGDQRWLVGCHSSGTTRLARLGHPSRQMNPRQQVSQ